MLAKDVFTLNNVDGKIQDIIGQLNELIERRTEITSHSSNSLSYTSASADSDFDFSSLDMTLEPRGGLSIARR